MSNRYVMKVSPDGQVAIPPEAWARWRADRVVVVDLGDRVVLRPMPDDPVAALSGRYHDRGPTADEAHRRQRIDHEAIEHRKQQ